MEKNLACIDTDVCVDFLRGKESGFAALAGLADRFKPCITAITAFELHLGHIKMKRKDSIDGFISQFIILPFDLKSSKTSAHIQAYLDKSGAVIGIPDTLIAGICIANNVPLLTMNVKHFSRVSGLKFVKTDW